MTEAPDHKALDDHVITAADPLLMTQRCPSQDQQRWVGCALA